MNREILQGVLEDTSALTASLPETIQQVAFSKTFDALLAERIASAQQQRRSRSRSSQPGASAVSSRGRGDRPRRIGPKSALGQLVNAGYFDSSRGLPEIQRYLRDDYGHDFRSNELSISLLRLIRDGRLSRKRNLAGQYEYWAESRKTQPHASLKHSKNTRLLTDGRN